MAKKKKTTRKKAKAGQAMTLAAATEAVGSAVGRAVGRVEQMMNLARERMARTTNGSKPPAATKRSRKVSGDR
jgi:hypothetical protein